MEHMTTLRCTVNGKPVQAEIPQAATLLYALREALGLTGTKEGCGEGDCGACTVLLDGMPVNSCICLAVQAEGREILTIEGVEDDPALSRIQHAFVAHGAVQCGYCSPGMILSAAALLAENGDPTEEEIRRGLSGNICRCTGYQAMVDAVQAVARHGGSQSTTESREEERL